MKTNVNCFYLRMRPQWPSSQSSSNRGRGSNSGGRYPGRGRSESRGYTSHPTPIIRMGNRVLVNENLSKKEEGSSSSSINLDDIPKDSPLYEALQKHMAEKKKQSNTYASVAEETVDSFKNYEQVPRKEVILLLENKDIQWRDDIWEITQKYLMDKLYFPGESYKTRNYYENILISTGSVEISHFRDNRDENVYNFSKMIIKRIISMEEWGISTMKENQMTLASGTMNFTYWDYIKSFSYVLYYNNYKHKHTWFIKVCSKIFQKNIPNWFVNWWTFHGPSIRILPEQFKTLYDSWIQVSPDLDKLYKNDHISWPENIGHVLFFIEFSIPWIHKWIPEFGYTTEQIPCIYRVYYNNFWDKMIKIDPVTKKIFGQETIDEITTALKIYQSKEKIENTIDNSPLKHIARRIAYQPGDRTQQIEEYLNLVKKNLLDSFEFIESTSDTSMKSQSNYADSQVDEEIDTEEVLREAEQLLQQDALEEADTAEDFVQRMIKAQGKKKKG